MKYDRAALIIIMFSFDSSADCLSTPAITFWQQLSYTHHAMSLWHIGNKKAYTTDNGFNELAINLRNACSLIDDKLKVAFSFYGLTYLPWQSTGPFETDRHRSRALTNQLLLIYNTNEMIRLDVGKFSPEPGLFFLKSPAKLLNTSYAGFKPTRLYDTEMRAVYEEAFWGGRVAATSGSYALSFTAAAKVTESGKRYETTGNWSSTQRSNASERYLFSWTDYRLANHTPSLQLMAGDSPGLAFADTFNATSQLALNLELALHRNQQWRHFSAARAAKVREYDFTPSLYTVENSSGTELALGGQYTTENMNIFGIEYYFQSEGYTESAWRKQNDFIKYLHRRTWNAELDNAYDKYKYLIAAEISNATNRGMLQKRHYIHAWANILMKDEFHLQPWFMLNMQDGSTMLGIQLQTPLSRISEQLEMWMGAWTSQGDNNSEFVLFGETLGLYLGFKYFL